MPNNCPSFVEIRTITVDETVDMLEGMTPPPSILVSRRLAIPPLAGDTPATMLIEAVSVHDHTLVVTIAKIVPGQEITSRILIADTESGPAQWMQVRSLQASDDLLIRGKCCANNLTASDAPASEAARRSHHRLRACSQRLYCPRLRSSTDHSSGKVRPASKPVLDRLA